MVNFHINNSFGSHLNGIVGVEILSAFQFSVTLNSICWEDPLILIFKCLYYPYRMVV